MLIFTIVALRKESVDRNYNSICHKKEEESVALRKESVDRNLTAFKGFEVQAWSLSARRAWIEIG